MTPFAIIATVYTSLAIAAVLGCVIAALAEIPTRGPRQ